MPLWDKTDNLDIVAESPTSYSLAGFRSQFSDYARSLFILQSHYLGFGRETRDSRSFSPFFESWRQLDSVCGQSCWKLNVGIMYLDF